MHKLFSFLSKISKKYVHRACRRYFFKLRIQYCTFCCRASHAPLTSLFIKLNTGYECNAFHLFIHNIFAIKSCSPMPISSHNFVSIQFQNEKRPRSRLQAHVHDLFKQGSRHTAHNITRLWYLLVARELSYTLLSLCNEREARDATEVK